MRYWINLLVETEEGKEIEETFLEGDGPITKYLEKIGGFGGDFLRMVVMKDQKEQ